MSPNYVFSEAFGSGEVASCIHIQCEEPTKLKCPNDSMAVGVEPSKDDCCPAAPSCQCTPCPTASPYLCPEGQLRVLQQIGTGQPGTCCDQYQCNDRGKIVH